MNHVVHFEILGGPGDDKRALQNFYAHTFDWTVDADNPQGYGTVHGEHDEGIGGAIDQAPDHAKVLIYIEVDDPAAYLEKVKAAGGQVVQDVTVIPDMVTYATFRDPAGNEVGLVQSSDE